MKGVYMKNGETTMIDIGNGVTEIMPPLPAEGPAEIDQGPLTDIWESIVRELRKENQAETQRQYLRRRKIKNSVVPILAAVAAGLILITPESIDLLPAGTQATMLIIVAMAAAAYLALVGAANREGVGR